MLPEWSWMGAAGALGGAAEPLAGRGQPGVSGLGLGPGLGLGMALTGGSGQQAYNWTNTLTNNFVALGLSEAEARRQMLALAEAANVTLLSAFQELNRQYLENQITQNELLVGAAGITDLFQDDLPKSIDLAGLALRSFSEQGGLDIALFEERVERAQGFIGSLDFVGALKAALQSGKWEDFSDALTRNLRESMLDAFATAAMDNPAFQALFKDVPTNITLGMEALAGGDASGAAALFAQAGRDFVTAMAAGEDWVQALIDASPEFKQWFDEQQAAALGEQVRGTLSSAVADAFLEGLGSGDFEGAFRTALGGLVTDALVQGFVDVISQGATFDLIADRLAAAFAAFREGNLIEAGWMLQDLTDLTAGIAADAAAFELFLDRFPELRQLLTDLGVITGEAAEDTSILADALRTTLDTILASADAVDTTAQEVARQQRLDALEFAISRARAVGDEIGRAHV